MRRASLLLGLALLAGCPVVEGPSIGVVGTTMQVVGSGFGATQVAGSAVEYQLAGTMAWVAAPPLSWSDTKIMIATPPRSGLIRVRNATEVPAGNALRVYAYAEAPIAQDPSVNALPLALACRIVNGSCAEAYSLAEFHRMSADMIAPSSLIVTSLSFPQPPDPGPFAVWFGSGSRSQISAGGEGVVILGEWVYFSQGGGGGRAGATYPDHARVVGYRRSDGAYRVFNVPGDRMLIAGLDADPVHGRVWVAVYDGGTNGHLLTFDPERLPSVNLDFGPTVGESCAGRQAEVCPVYGVDLAACPTDAGCWHAVPVANPAGHPSQLLFDGAYMWVSYSWANQLSRVDPVTGASWDIPLPACSGCTAPGGGPWGLSRRGDGHFLAWSYESGVGRLDLTRPITDCVALVNGLNPCVELLPFPTHAAETSTRNLHSLAYDLDGKLWTTTWTNQPNTDREPDGVIVVTADWRRTIPLGLGALTDGSMSGTGIVATPNGTILFNELYDKKLGVLRPMM